MEDIYDRVQEEYSVLNLIAGDPEYTTIVESTSKFDPDPEIEALRDDEPEEFLQQMEDFIGELNTRTIGYDLIVTYVQNVIIDCQLCIELSVKAMFKLVGKDHPFSHGVSFEDHQTKGFYYEVPDGFQRKEDIVRVIFLTQFWEGFYELAKYGAPGLNVRPETIFDINDGARAIEDAEYCIEVAQDLLRYVEDNLEN